MMKKLFKRSVWCLLGIFFFIFFLISYVGGNIAKDNDSFINDFLNVQDYEIIETEEGVPFNEYKSDYVNEDGTYNDRAMRENSLNVAYQTATEGTVLLENKENTLPLQENAKISVFGISSVKYLFSAAGSGHLGVSVTTTLQDACTDAGITINPTLYNAYTLHSSKYGNYLTGQGTTISGNSIGDNCYVEYGINEVPWDQLGKTTVGNVENSFSSYGDAAVLLISRNDGEDGDTNYNTPEGKDGRYLDLALEEITILDNLFALKERGVFKKVILMINAAMAMDMRTISTYDLDALVWLGVGGNVSYEQIAGVLSGESEPSGRTPDTYLYDNYSAPSTVNQGDFTFADSTGLPARETYSHNNKYLVYSEGIYVGYRYFETRYEDSVIGRGNAKSSKGSKLSTNGWDYNSEVKYPFGYGLSYTEFEYKNFRVRETASGYEASLTVKNIGSRPGKETVQIYLQKPYTDYDIENKVEKPAVELVGFGKTSLLDINAEETVTVSISMDDFKSYDSYNAKTYILEKGDYYLSYGINAHDALNNILDAKGYTTTDGMDYNGNDSFVYRIQIANDDFERFSVSAQTGYKITNQFDDADVTLYEGVKDQFQDFRYLSRSDWDATYPVPAVMDCKTDTMRADLQYAKEVVEEEGLTMPTFGKSGARTLISMWGLAYDDESWNDLLDQVTWEEAVTLATYGGGTAGCVSVNAPNALAKDGPGGIGVGNVNLPSVMCFPSEVNMAATFNLPLIERLGNAFGMEILHVGYTGIYGPGANIHRSNFSGRNWEYYSEDPFISGEMLAYEVRGLQNRGAIVFTKHFLLNDQERNRYGVSVFANEQSIREIYLKAFEGGVVDADMNGLMSSFNRIGCTWAGKHKGLLTEVLRNEWGFIGVVQTDAYVGTHMHRALAESIVAGNDFTMGGSNPTALDAYRDSPTVANALRETVKRILYTKLHSNAMTGMTVNSQIVYITPWWKTAIDVLAITSVVIAAACFLMFGISCLLPVLDKRKRKLEELPEYQGRTVRYFFDVITKKMTIISSSIAAVLIVVAVAVPVGLSLSGPKGAHGSSSSTPDSSSYVYECEHKCATCGLCLDYNSTEEACAHKCGENLSETQTFEAEDPHVFLYPGDSGTPGIAKEPGSTETYVGGYNANLGAEVKFVFDSPSDMTATLVVSVCKRNSPLLFTSFVLVQVNGEILQSRGIVPSLAEGESEWVTFTDVVLGCISLKEGRNALKFTVISNDASCGFNFDALRIKTDTEVSWYEGDHICDDICPVCGLCMNSNCKDPVCADKCTCNLDQYEFMIADNKYESEGAVTTSDRITFNAPDQKLTFRIKSTSQITSIISVDIASLGAEAKFSDLFSLVVNGTEVSVSDVTIPATTVLTTYKVGPITLSYGENLITLVSKSNTAVTLAGIKLGCEQLLDYKNPHEFLTTSDYVTIEGDAYKSSENCISMNEEAMGSVITFPINSSKATTADLYVNIASRSTACKIADILLIKVNGTAITTDADRPTVGQDFFTYSDVFIANVSLVEGYNEITFEVLNSNPNINTNLRAIIFDGTDANLTFATTNEGAVRYIIEGEATTITPYVDSSGSYPFVAGGQNASGDQYLGGVNDAGLYGPGQAKITFNVTASVDVRVRLYFCVGISGSAKASSYTVRVNGNVTTSNQNWSANDWYDWKECYYGRLDLTTGDNTIEVTIEKNEPINLDYFLLECNSDVLTV